MKNIITFILLVTGFLGNAQIYVLKQDTIIQRQERVFKSFKLLSDNKSNTNEINLKSGYYLKKQKETKDSVFVSVLPFKDSIRNKVFFKRQKKSNDIENPDVFFGFLKSDFKQQTQKVESRFGFGTVILPLKIRFGGGDSIAKTKRYFDFTADVNLGLSLNYRFNRELAQIKKYFIINLSTSSVKVNKDNTNGYVKTETNASAISPSVGFVFEFNNAIQLMTCIGVDFVAGKLGREWIYRDKPYLGIGIGFSLFKFNDKSGYTTQPSTN